MPINDYLVYVFLLIGVLLSITTGRLTVLGAIFGGITGLFIFKGAGYVGLGMLLCFFVLGTVATSWRSDYKQKLGIAEDNKGKRTAGQVLANGGIVGVLGALGWMFPDYHQLFRLMIAGSLASATADTLSSELGSIYGRKFYHIITFKISGPGPNGVVSMEGTMIGLMGATLIAFIFAIGFNAFAPAWVVVVAGVAGNLTDSVLGATLEEKGLLGNNMVNMLNTFTGALVCFMIYKLSA